MVSASLARAAVTAGAVALHPLHTTLTELSYRAADGTVEVSVRAFADDFRMAAARYAGVGAPGGDLPESTAFAYLAATLTLTGPEGRPVALSSCGVRRTGDLVWLCLRGSAPRGLAGVRVDVRLLCELYSDQINILQASYGGRRTSLLFARGDAARPLP